MHRKPVHAHAGLVVEHAELLEEAMKRPGVREAMEVYGNWERLDSLVRPYLQNMKKDPILSVSTGSVPIEN